MFAKLRSLIRFIRHYSTLREIDVRMHTISGLMRIDETLPEDIFIVGYPKSGNTWMQNLLAGLVYGLDPEYMPVDLFDHFVPDVHQLHYYRRFGTPMHFKSHSLPHPEYRRVIYLLRDGRDVMVSFFHHLSAFPHDGEIEFADMVRTGRNLFPSKWHEHVNAWQSNPYNAEIMILKYEDLLADPVKQLARVCQFLAINRSISLIESVVEKSSFARMRAKEERNPPPWKDKLLVRRGIVGSYKDEMPKPVLDLFLADAADTLRACDYL